MASIPYVVALEGTIAGSGTIELSYQIARNESLIIKDMIHVSAGAFDLIDITDSAGMRYTNATQSNGVPNTLLKDGVDNYHGINPFSMPLTLEGGRTIYLTLLDTSASSNLVNIVLVCERILPN